MIIPVFWPTLARAYLDLGRLSAVLHVIPIFLRAVSLGRPGVADEKKTKYVRNHPSTTKCQRQTTVQRDVKSRSR